LVLLVDKTALGFQIARCSREAKKERKKGTKDRTEAQNEKPKPAQESASE